MSKGRQGPSGELAVTYVGPRRAGYVTLRREAGGRVR